MVTLARFYVANPFSSIVKKFNLFCEVAGYSRAAAHLASLGYHDEAKACMMEIAKLKS